jgi:hypothetical protein
VCPSFTNCCDNGRLMFPRDPVMTIFMTVAFYLKQSSDLSLGGKLPNPGL